MAQNQYAFFSILFSPSKDPPFAATAAKSGDAKNFSSSSINDQMRKNILKDFFLAEKKSAEPRDPFDRTEKVGSLIQKDSISLPITRFLRQLLQREHRGLKVILVFLKNVNFKFFYNF